MPLAVAQERSKRIVLERDRKTGRLQFVFELHDARGLHSWYAVAVNPEVAAQFAEELGKAC